MNLNEREKALEDLYAHDQELHFKIRSRRNKSAGLWAGEQLGKSSDAASAYALELVSAFLTRQQLFDRLRTDFSANSIAVDDKVIAAKIIEFTDSARLHFMSN